MEEKKATYFNKTVSKLWHINRTISSDIGNHAFQVVAIGAPAEGVTALLSLMEYLSPDLGMAYIIIQHFSAESTDLQERLEKRTTMKVEKAMDRMVVERDRVYLIPGNTSMGFTNGRLILLSDDVKGVRRNPIDLFETMLATACREKAIAIILSGSSVDGSAGAGAIRAEGGFVFAQGDGDLSEGMPNHAAVSGNVDFLLPLDKIAAGLASWKTHVAGGSQDWAYGKNKTELGKVYHLLLDKGKIDFSRYDEESVNRRILRRMTLIGVDSLESYVQYCQVNEGEVMILSKDVMVNLRGFYRYPSVYRHLTRYVLPVLLKNRKESAPLRIWVPGCSTGEETWSLAICILEYCQDHALGIPVKIFATDLSEVAVQVARTGSYNASAMTNVAQRRLRRFFTQAEGRCQVGVNLREMCIFTPHDLLTDPPFSRIDLIWCNNVLVESHPDWQKKILQTFHFALKPTGFLFPGLAEMMTGSDRLFSQVIKDMRFFQPVAGVSFSDPRGRNKLSGDLAVPLASSAVRMDPHAAATDILLSGYVPASVLIDDAFRILHFYGDNSSFIRLSSGRASLLLPALLREELLPDLYTLMDRAKKERGRVSIKGMEIVPVGKRIEDKTFLVIFKESALAVPAGKNGHPPYDQDHENMDTLTGLRLQLEDMTRRMRTLGEDSQQMLLQLQAAHEEVLSANEELQSINEELEVSREELHSVIGELKTINETLQARNDQLKSAAGYAEAIVGTIREPLLILFSDMHIQSANKAFYVSYGLSSDKVEGHAFSDVGNGIFANKDLLGALGAMLSAKESSRDFELEFAFPGKGERILHFTATRMNGAPGRRARIALTIEDITDRKAVERHKDEFIGIASHELKTPVNSIHAYTQILHDTFREADDEKSLQLVSKLSGQVTRLTNLTRDLLDVTRISEGQLSLKEAWFDPGALVREICEEMQEGGPQPIVVDLPSDCPQLLGDRDRIGQVLVNLLSNALKYSPNAAQVSVRVRVHQNDLMIVVKDLGVGIDGEIRKKIFDRFFRSGDAAASGSPGLGLGLFISHEIIRKHGGKINVDSEIGKGSVFSVILPIKMEGIR